jgi:hypothetical protein
MGTLTLRSLTFLTDDALAMSFDTEDGRQVTHQFTRERTGAITVVNGDDDFRHRYRQVPGPESPRWPEQFAHAAWAARDEPLPVIDASGPR